VVVGRIFVAVDLTDEVRHGLVEHLAATIRRPFPGRPVKPGNWHLTLRFIGPLDEVLYDRLLEGLGREPLGDSFRLGFLGLGGLPRAERATVLVQETGKGSEELASLAERVAAICETIGFPPEGRPFRPHLTLSRIRPHQDVRSIVADSAPFPLTQEVHQVWAFRSRLGRGGAEYERLEAFPLGEILGSEQAFD